MIIVIILLIIGIIVRWEYVAHQAGEAFGGLFSH
jgi:hypothetical protein